MDMTDQERMERQPYYIEQLKQLYESIRHDDRLANVIAGYYYASFIVIAGGSLKLYVDCFKDSLRLFHHSAVNLLFVLGVVFILFYIIGMGLLLTLIKNNKTKWRSMKQIKIIQGHYLIAGDSRSFDLFDKKTEGEREVVEEGDVMKVAEIYAWVMCIVQSVVLIIGLALLFNCIIFNIFYVIFISLFASILHILFLDKLLAVVRLEETDFSKKLKEIIENRDK